MISFSLVARIFVDVGDGSVGRLLHLVGLALLLVLADFAVLLGLLEVVEPVATDMADRDAGRLGIFVRNLDELLAAILRHLGDAQADHLPLGLRVEPEIGVRGSPSRRRRPCHGPRPAR